MQRESPAEPRRRRLPRLRGRRKEEPAESRDQTPATAIGGTGDRPSRRQARTQTPALEPIPPIAIPRSERPAGWAELARQQHGERQPFPIDEEIPAPRPASHERSEPRASASRRATAALTGSDIDQLAARISRVESELDSSIAVLFDQIGRVDDKLDATERGLSDAFAEFRSMLEALSPAAAGEPPSGESGSPASQIGLNSATFDDLRGLGLSVTQAARIIAFRDTHGPFGDFGELEEIRGLSDEDLRMLGERTTL